LLLYLGNTATASAGPRLIFIPVAESEAEIATEAEVEQELLLTLDAVSLETRARPDPGFAGMPIAQQLPLLAPWWQEDGVLAVGWLDPLSAAPLRFHLVVVAEGRTVLRVVEAAPGAAGPGALALAIREVLSLVRLSRQREPAQDETAPRETLSSKAPPRQWSLHVLPGVAIPPPSAAGPSPLGQLQLGFAVQLKSELWLTTSGLLLLGGGDQQPFTLTSAGGGAGLRWLPGNERVGAGPLLSVLFLHTRLMLSEGDQPTTEHFDVRVAPGFGLRLAPVPTVRLLLAASVDLMPRPWEARLRSTGEQLLKSTPAQFRLSLGVEFVLPGRVRASNPSSGSSG